MVAETMHTPRRRNTKFSFEDRPEFEANMGIAQFSPVFCKIPTVKYLKSILRKTRNFISVFRSCKLIRRLIINRLGFLVLVKKKSEAFSKAILQV
jgi:hypothetical protein